MRANTPSKPRWRLQFTVRAMLLLTLLCALGLGWIANERRKVWLENRAVKEIRQAGGYAPGEACDGDLPRFSYSAWAQEALFGKRTRVELVGVPVGKSPDIIEQFPFLPDLDFVDLRGVRVRDKHIPAIVAASKIEYLDLSATDVTDAGVTQLAALSNLDALYLDHTEITDESLEALGRLNLSSLSICDTAVSDQAANRLRKEHPRLEIEHRCSPSSATHRKASRELVQRGAFLSCSGDDPPLVTTDVMLYPAGDRCHVPWIGTPEDLARLANIDGKVAVSLDWSLCTKEFVQQLARLDAAEELTVHLRCDRCEVLRRLAGMETLESLHIRFRMVKKDTFGTLNGEDLSFLAELPNLKHLSISLASPRVALPWDDASQRALLAVAKCPSLQHLELSWINISEETLAKIVECPSLKTLEVWETPNPSKAVIERCKRVLKERVESRK